MAAATGEWVLWLNPDEELLSPEPLIALLGDAPAFAYGVRVLDVMDPTQPERTAETWQLRLYRRHPDVRYVGRLHPQFVVPLDELGRRQGQPVAMSDVWLRRHAHLSQLTPEKVRWAIRLLELELRNRPGQLHYLIEYGQNLLLLNDPRGHAVLAEAAERVRAVRDAPAAPAPAVASLLAYLLTVAPEQWRRPRDRGPVSRTGAAVVCSQSAAVVAAGPAPFTAGAFAAAAELLERLIALGRSGTYDRTAAFDPRIMGGQAALNLARCYIHLGELARAEACLVPLMDHPTDHVQARALLQTVTAQRAVAGRVTVAPIPPPPK